MELTDRLALQIYLVGVALFVVLAWRYIPKIPDKVREAERKAMAEAFAPDAPVGKVRRAKKAAERARDDLYTLNQALSLLGTGPGLGILCFLIGAMWPGILLWEAFKYARWGVFFAWNVITGTRISCDGCECDGPWGWTGKKSRLAAAQQGWMVDHPKDEDYCPACSQTDVTSTPDRADSM